MGVLKFDNVDDAVSFSSLDSSLQNLPGSAWTIAALFRRVSTPGDFDGITYLSVSGSATLAGFSMNNGNHPQVDVGSGSAATSTLTNITLPYLIVISKVAGSAIPLISWKLGSAGAWTDSDTFNLSLGNQSAADTLDIGHWLSADPANSWIGLVGYWTGVLSTAQKHELGANWRTSDWWNNSWGLPSFLCELNVAAASLTDLAANCVFNVATGTTLDAAETLDGWNFDGYGSAAQVPPATEPDLSTHPKRRLVRI